MDESSSTFVNFQYLVCDDLGTKISDLNYGFFYDLPVFTTSCSLKQNLVYLINFISVRFKWPKNPMVLLSSIGFSTLKIDDNIFLIYG